MIRNDAFCSAFVTSGLRSSIFMDVEWILFGTLLVLSRSAEHPLLSSIHLLAGWWFELVTTEIYSILYELCIYM